MAAALTYAIAVNFVGSYRRPADMVGDSTIGFNDSFPAGSGSELEDEKPSAHIREASIVDGAQVLAVEKQDQRRASMQSANARGEHV
jgi:hypothetical protein